MTEEIPPLGESILEAFIDAYLKKNPDITRDEARKKLVTGELDE